MPGLYRSDKSLSSSDSAGPRAFESVDGGEQPSPESIRLLRRDTAAGVTVVCFGDSAAFHGVTVASCTIVSLAPPRLLFCLGTGSEALASMMSVGHCAVCVLGDRQEFLADQFAGRAPAVNRRFDGIRFRPSQLGDPILEECLVWFSGKVDGTSIQGDHVVVFCAIQEAGFGTGREPLLYFDGEYRRLQFS